MASPRPAPLAPLPISALPSTSTSTSATLAGSSPVAGPGGAWQSKPRRWISQPPEAARLNRTLVLCFDGTGDSFDDDNSNIVQLMAMLKKDDPTKQLAYYQSGIGTYTKPTTVNPLLVGANKTLDQMFAVNLSEHVRDGYEFLMQNYQAGDKICIFGFSRGAYTARSLAGMVQKVGLLPAWNKQQLAFAYHFFSHEDDKSLKLCQEFKRTFSTDVKIEFVGVWDTVSSVGLIPRYLPFVTTNNAIRYFRHALALDEHRIKFLPSFYKQGVDKKKASAASVDAATDGAADTVKSTDKVAIQETDDEDDEDDGASHNHSSGIRSKFSRKKDGTPERPDLKGHRHEHSEAYKFQEALNAATGETTDALEVWFSGVHTDVGGGSVENHTRHCLARIPLRWMIRECFNCNAGIIFDMDMLRDEVGLDIDLENRKLLPVPDRRQPELRIIPDDPVVPLMVSVVRHAAHIAALPARLVFWLARQAFFAIVPRQRARATLPRAPGANFSEEPFEGEAIEEMKDAMCQMYDQLAISRGWWVLEWAPLRIKKEKAIYDVTDRYDDFAWLINNGSGRKVYKHVVTRGMKVHRSVKTRLQARDVQGQLGAYIPLARPHILVEEDGKRTFDSFRKMTREEWLTRRVKGADKPWFEWEGNENDERDGADSPLHAP